ncbi:MAG: hypothetical protein Q4C34_07195 [Bacteroidales bacterium]|nr:hypothetical protein [Bacteroidales bacterium]
MSQTSSAENKVHTLRVIAPGREFVLPYIEAALPDVEIVGEDAGHTIVIASPADAGALADSYPGAAVLVCAEIIGTGMTGFPRRLAEAVMRGSFMHVPGRQVPVSIVHAVDVGRAAALVIGKPGVYRLADTAGHDVDELADALAVRMGDKRIFTLRMRFLQWLFRPSFERLTRGLQAVDGTSFAETFGFTPVNVTNYLRTHVYDESSL